MKAVTKKYDVATAAVQAYKAGCNILLYCNDFAAPEIALKALIDAASKNEINQNEIVSNHRKILDLKKAKIKNFNLGTYSEIQHLIGATDHIEMAKAVNEGRMPQLSNINSDDDD